MRIEIPNLLEHPMVVKIAKRHQKTAAQVLMRYIAQLGIAVIPKSSNPDRIRANFEVQLPLQINDIDRILSITNNKNNLNVTLPLSRYLTFICQ